MGPGLDGLIKLQSVENRLRAVKAKLTRCRRNVVIQENKIRNLQNTIEAKKEEVQLTKVQSDRLELELKSRDDTITNLRASLNTAKTNKEYAAVLTQLNTTRADNAKVETQILDLMKDIEADEDASTLPAEQGGFNARRLLQRQLFGRGENVPGISTVMVEAFNIVQDRIARSRLAGDPPDAMISPRLQGINLFDFHRASEIIELGRKAAEREIETIKQEIAVREQLGLLHSRASA